MAFKIEVDMNNFSLDIDIDPKDICRICLKTSQAMTDLYNLSIPESSDNIIDFLRRITQLKLIKSESLPVNVCSSCLNTAFTAYRLVQQCIASDSILRNYETRRMLRKIEDEALRDEDTAVKLEEPWEDSVKNDEDICNDKVSSWEVENTARKSKYQCEKCPMGFSNKRKFTKHQTVHFKMPYECIECNQTFSKQLHLDVHSRSHSKEKKYTCDKCGQQFIFEYLLKQHEYKHSENKPFPCTQCSKGCLTAESLKRHMKIHEVGYRKKSYICDTCKKSFPYLSFLQQHIKSHTGEKPHLCSVCGKGFRQSGALHFHQRIHTGQKPFECNTCKQAFISQSVLKIHMRKHTNERPYVCNTCGTSFRQVQDLKRHGSIHTGEKRILCPVCGKKMATSGQLTIHLRSHTGEKPFGCTECEKSFATRHLLRKHTAAHQRGSVRCPKSYKSKKSSGAGKNTRAITKDIQESTLVIISGENISAKQILIKNEVEVKLQQNDQDQSDHCSARQPKITVILPPTNTAAQET
ncbi:unnamed protein product [Callosobruchus maculatus]|uniref:Protein krueppel n=1 Tax=Callosobruchus maculatus TaxID=64391 RepID=A0A653BI75_CALMS|nr:unnamed protein product [Callosobruchus maculatus]